MPHAPASHPAPAPRKVPGRSHHPGPHASRASKGPGRRQGAAKARKAGEGFQPQQVGLGDTIRVERRFVLDGQMTCVADKGVFHGVQAMGSVEHILIECKGEVRLIPLQSVSEIVLEEAAPRGPGAADQEHKAFDPSFA